MTIAKMHPITDIIGIDSSLEKELAKLGIIYTEDLLTLSTDFIIYYMESIKELTYNKLMYNFLPQARFLMIKNIDSRYSSALVESGFYFYRDMVNSSTKKIITLLKERKDEGMIDTVPKKNSIIEWQLDSARRIGTGFFHITILDETSNNPIEGVEIRINNLDLKTRLSLVRTTEKNGLAIFEFLVPGKHRAFVTAKDYLRHTVTFEIEVNSAVRVLVKLIAGEHKPFIIDEFEGEAIHSIGLNDRILSRRVKFKDLNPLPPAHIIEIKESDVVLSSIWRRKIDEMIEVYTFILPKDKLPKDISLGDVVLPQSDGKYNKSNQTLLEFRRKFLMDRPFKKEYIRRY